MDHLNIMVVRECTRTESHLRAISGKPFGKKSVLTALVPTQPVALSVGIINVDQRVVQSAFVKDKAKNNISTYKIHNTNEDVSFCKQAVGNTLSLTTVDTDRKGSNSSKVSSCEQTESNTLSPTIDSTIKNGSKSSEVSPREDVQASSPVMQ